MAIRLIDKSNEDYDLVSEDITIEFSRGIDPLTEKAIWRLWCIRLNRHTIVAFGTGKVLKTNEFTRKLEKLYREQQSN